MSEKHDAMWGPEAGEYIAQQQAEIERLNGRVNEFDEELTKSDSERRRLRAALKEIVDLYRDVRLENDYSAERMGRVAEDALGINEQSTPDQVDADGTIHSV